MSIFKTRGAVAAVALLLVASPAAASVSLDFLASFNPTNDVHVQLRATTGYFQPSRNDLERCARIVNTPDEMAVVFFLARASGVSVRAILERRGRGDSWFSIMVAVGVPADVLYVELPEHVGPPYGKAHGYHRKHKSESRRPRLTDDQIVDLVGLQLTAGYYRADPVRVVEQRRTGLAFSAIQGELFRASQAGSGVTRQRAGADPDAPQQRPGKGRGNGRGGGR